MSGGRFDRCLRFTLVEEGGYSDVAGDRGGPTNLGLTHTTIAEAVRRGILPAGTGVGTISRDEAAKVYEELYWKPSGCPALPAPLDLCLFDAYVNHRPKVAVRLIQAALKVDQDGIVGPATLHAAASLSLVGTVERYCHWREQLYRRIVTDDESQTKFLRGWLNRIAHVKAAALAECA